jgi:hypothetical protein
MIIQKLGTIRIKFLQTPHRVESSFHAVVLVDRGAEPNLVDDVREVYVVRLDTGGMRGYVEVA